MIQLRHFDMLELQHAVDDARQARGLSWAAVAAEINMPFEGTPSIPISVSTIRDMHKKASVTSGVVLQVLRWLRRTPESFLSGEQSTPIANADLPEPGPSRILRFDTRAMYTALDTERIRRGIKWKEIAGQLPGFTESTLRNLSTGPLIGFPRAMLIPQLLGRPAAAFIRIDKR